MMSKPNVLAQHRQARGWSQAELAARSGVSRAEVSGIETGRLVPSVAVALGLAGALEATVESLFGSAPADSAAAPAWPGPVGDDRVWWAEVGGRVRAYPVEPTAAGAIPHDAAKGAPAAPRTAALALARRTLVLAGCDPLAGLLERELSARGVRVIPLLRSSTEALDLLRRGLVHAAGVHFTDAAGRSANDRAVRTAIGSEVRVIHQLRWETGIVLGRSRRERSATALLRANVRWVNREAGSAARQTFDALLAARRRPAGYGHVVRDHRAVAATVSSGWAEAGVCVRPAAAEMRLSFVPLHREAYELCIAGPTLDDPRIAALVSVLQSAAYRWLVADTPGCVARSAGEIRAVAGASRDLS